MSYVLTEDVINDYVIERIAFWVFDLILSIDREADYVFEGGVVLG
jgi:hypothetical protein